MPTYIMLLEYTEEGIKNMEDSPDRLEAARDVCRDHGGEITDFYLTLGQFDAVAIATFPDDEAAAQALLTIGGHGAVSTETLKAFTEDEYRDVIAGL